MVANNEASPDGARQKQHKRQASALGRQEGVGPSSPKEARPSEEEEEAQKAEGPTLTERNQMRLLGLRTSQEELLKKIDEITAAGVELLDRMRAGFLQSMHTAKLEVAGMVDQAQEALAVESEATLDRQQRILMASQLVGRLSHGTQDQQQQRLFSVEEEAQEEEEGQAEGAALD